MIKIFRFEWGNIDEVESSLFTQLTHKALNGFFTDSIKTVELTVDIVEIKSIYKD